jgi:dipeptidase E
MALTGRRLLLISNSTVYSREYLDHVANEIKSFLGNSKTILFVPFALHDRDAYAEKVRMRFAAMGYQVESIHRSGNTEKALARGDSIFVGGGNTFRLLKELYALNLIEPIRQKVQNGTRYIGSSAGSIIAGPTIKTTKDMPIVQPPSFDALGLMYFQISPHYLDSDPRSTHMGETQEERILQFLEENDAPVVGLREGAWLLVEGNSVTLKGATGARVFRRNQPPVEGVPGSDISELVEAMYEA